MTYVYLTHSSVQLDRTLNSNPTREYQLMKPVENVASFDHHCFASVVKSFFCFRREMESDNNPFCTTRRPEEK